MPLTVRTNYGASLSPDATAFAHLVDDGGYPRAVQRFLRGWRASSSRDVELPVEGPVTPAVPASILQTHPDCVLFVDPAAAGLLREPPGSRPRGGSGGAGVR